MAMADLAKYSQGSAVSIAAIAERQELSTAYLEQLFSKLRRSGLVTSVRGPGGGYLLARQAHDIAISQIMFAVEEPVTMTRCDRDIAGGCVGDARCLTHDLWRALSNHLKDFLGHVTLGDVLDNANAKEYAIEVTEKKDSHRDEEAPHEVVAGR